MLQLLPTGNPLKTFESHQRSCWMVQGKVNKPTKAFRLEVHPPTERVPFPLKRVAFSYQLAVERLDYVGEAFVDDAAFYFEGGG